MGENLPSNPLHSNLKGSDHKAAAVIVTTAHLVDSAQLHKTRANSMLDHLRIGLITSLAPDNGHRADQILAIIVDDQHPSRVSNPTLPKGTEIDSTMRTGTEIRSFPTHRNDGEAVGCAVNRGAIQEIMHHPWKHPHTVKIGTPITDGGTTIDRKPHPQTQTGTDSLSLIHI